MNTENIGYATLAGGFYDSITSSWKTLTPEINAKHPEHSLESLKQLSVVSYNVWFAEQDQEVCIQVLHQVRF